MLRFLQLVLVTALLLINTTSRAAIGHITTQTGPTEIQRKNSVIPGRIDAPVEMQDTIVTARARAEIAFADKTTVKITEQSKLVIDEFVYDAKQGAGKLALKVALGTARYASGQIAKNNPQSVNIQTPTATVAVRGTDFSMTVDELGRSLVVLLPSCDSKTCVTGAIVVQTDAGSVFMDVAYQTTLVNSRDQPPSKPVVVALDAANINNLLIIAPPREVRDQDIQTQAKSELDFNYLDQDLLRYDELDKDELQTGLRELDINLLDAELLINFLDQSAAAMLAGADQILSTTNQLLPGYTAASGITYFFNDDATKVTLVKNAAQYASITVPQDQSKTVVFNQEGVITAQPINKGGTTTITLIQK